jgi:hypothetical protein
MSTTKKPAVPLPKAWSRLQTRQQAFLAAYTKGDLVAQIKIARTAAHYVILAHGVDADNLDTFAELAGPHTAIREEDWPDYCVHLSAAFAFGIAIGQLVHPDVFFKTGGVK